MSIKRINIYEEDRTTPSGTGTSTDVAYVPGLAKIGPVGEPIELKSEEKLVETFGDGPVVFSENYQFNVITPSDNSSTYELTVDTVSNPDIKHIDSYYTERISASEGTDVYTTCANDLSIDEDKTYYTIEYREVNVDISNWYVRTSDPESYSKATSFSASGVVYCTLTDSIDSLYVSSGDDYVKAEDPFSVSTAYFLINATKVVYNEGDQGSFYELSGTTYLLVSEPSVGTEYFTLVTIPTALSPIVVYDGGKKHANKVGSGSNETHNIDYTVDLSYVYAKELIMQGLTVVYERVTDVNTVDAVYDALYKVNLDQTVTSCFDKLSDVGEYDVKFITSGAYPLYYVTGTGDQMIGQFGGLTKMVSVASTRGDSVAVVDHVKGLSKDFYDRTIKNCEGVTDGEYGTFFTTWGAYNLPNSGENTMPASFGYLMALAKSVKTNANYLAVAGTARGHVPYIKNLVSDYTLTNSLADSYQEKTKGVTAINAITTINPYGLTLWGNRTLLRNDDGLKAGSYLNLRNLLSDVKKSLRDIALSLLFEQNSDVLWLKFKSRISPVLDKMVAGNGILAYNLIKNKTTDKSKFSVDVLIQPIYPVEEVEIRVVVTDDDVTVA